MGKYRRASNKQIEYIRGLFKQLNETDITLYKKLSSIEASKLINRLQRKVNKRKAESRQMKLL